MTKTVSIYRTEQYPASVIFQNHLDVIQGLLESYCSENKDYRWGIVYDSRRIGAEEGVALKYLKKYEPDSLKYFVVGTKGKSELILQINNGVSISIRNGTYELYGLFTLLMDASDSMSSPHVFVFLRRYWLFSIFFAGLVIPMLIILLAGGGWWSLAWFVLAGLIEGGITAYLLDTWDWDDYILSTKIRYDEFSKKTLGPLGSVFGSVKGIITVLASIATIVTFFIFLSASH